MNVSVLIGTYGEQAWSDLAWSRAYPSADAEAPYEIGIEHQASGTIASVRNALAEEATGEWLCFLDADDELGTEYLIAMLEVWTVLLGSFANAPLLLTPRVAYVTGKTIEPPKFWPEKPLWEGNWLVIGTLIPRALFYQVGGFEEEIHGYEDWSLFARCWKAGAQIVKVPDAIYRAHVDPNSRNRRMPLAERLYWHQRIGANIFPERYEEPTAMEDEVHALLNGTHTAKHLRMKTP